MISKVASLLIAMRTTITIPDTLASQVDSLIQSGNIKSRNQFIVEALEDKIKQIKEIQLDSEFAQMATDEDYQKEALEIEEDFAFADAEVSGF